MPSLFIGVYTALYPYQAQTDQEIGLAPGDLLYLLEKSTEDDWWKVKKRVPGAETEEPVGLVPNNYIQKAPVVASAKALYPYDRQTEEEISFVENDLFDVYDTSDNDWILVGAKKSPDYGFVPSNYIQLGAAGASLSDNSVPAPVVQKLPTSVPPAQSQAPVPSYPGQDKPLPDMPRESHTEPVREYRREPERYEHRTQSFSRDIPQEEDDDVPSLPNRSRDNSAPEPPSASSKPQRPERDQKFHNWYVQEVDGRKKYKATLSIGNGSIMYSSTRTESESQQWPIDDLINYNSEKKHVFLELRHPTLSLDLHAGSKETAEEITSVLGDLAGALKAVGLREVIAAAKSAGQKMGKVLYDFQAQQDDEVSAKEGENIFVIDSERSREWWLIRNAQGREGMIPASYIEVAPEPTSSKRLSFYPKQKSKPEKSKRGTSYFSKKDKERDREEREQKEYELAKEREYQRQESRRREYDDTRDERRERTSRSSKSKPDPSKVRTWTDRSGAFKVDAAFLGCVDGKIQLHKVNGVKVAVPVNKMSLEDLEYVERHTGISLEDDKPLRDGKKSSTGAGKSGVKQIPGGLSTNGASASRSNESAVAKAPSNPTLESRAAQSSQPTVPEFDWFGFFLDCGVDINNCQKYSINFTRDQMDESVLPDITPSVLRTLGLKEGDILRVSKKIDEKYRSNGDGQRAGGLFTNQDGSLRNNTSRSQLQPPPTTLAVVSPQTQNVAAQPTAMPNTNASSQGFADDAWVVKSVQMPEQAPQPVPQQAPQPVPQQAPQPVPQPIPQPAVYSNNEFAANSTASVASNTPQSFQPQPTGTLKEFLDFVPLKPQQTAAAINSSTSMSQPNLSSSISVPQSNIGSTSSLPNSLQPQRTGGGTVLTIPVTIPIAIQPMANTGTNPGLMSQPTGGFSREPLNPFLTGSVAGLSAQATGGFSNFATMGSQPTGGFSNFATMGSQPTGGFSNFTSISGQVGPPTGSTPMVMATPMGTQMTPQMSAPMGTQMAPQMTAQMSTPMGIQMGTNPFMSQANTAANPFMSQQPAQTGFGVGSMNQLNNQMAGMGIQAQPSFGQPNTQPFTQPNISQTSFTQPQNTGYQMTIQPLQTQPTGFGFGNVAPQTGLNANRRANLNSATAQNPFGF